MADTILRVSQLVTDFTEINEFEINPNGFRRRRRGISR
ncbi:MAG: hypothetical protein ABFC12_00130 [Methanobacterium sp.]